MGSYLLGSLRLKLEVTLYQMSPYLAYLLGLLTVLLIVIPFWVLSMNYQVVSDSYLTIFCKQAYTYPIQ